MDAVDYCRPDVCPKTSATVRTVPATDFHHYKNNGLLVL